MRKIILLTLLSTICISCDFIALLPVPNSSGTNNSITYKEDNLIMLEGSLFVYDDEIFTSERATKLNKDAMVHIKNGMFEQAYLVLHEALDLEPENYVLMNNLGGVLQRLSKYPLAYHYFEQSFNATNGHYAIANINLAYWYRLNYEFEEAQNLLEGTLPMTDGYTEGITAYYLASTYYDINECEKAQTIFSIAKRKIPETNWYNYKINALEKRIIECLTIPPGSV